MLFSRTFMLAFVIGSTLSLQIGSVGRSSLRAPAPLMSASDPRFSPMPPSIGLLEPTESAAPMAEAVGVVVPTAVARPSAEVAAVMRDLESVWGETLDERRARAEAIVAGQPQAKERVKTPTGIFAPAVTGAKAVMGTKELNALRADIIAKHTKVISAFVDTNESPFGQIVIRKMFEAADKDGNGTLDRQEVKEALKALGFTFVEDKQIDQIFSRGDKNKDDVIDFEEFVKETPKALRTNLVKLAKSNGHDLGFLA